MFHSSLQLSILPLDGKLESQHWAIKLLVINWDIREGGYPSFKKMQRRIESQRDHPERLNWASESASPVLHPAATWASVSLQAQSTIVSELAVSGR